MPCCFAIIKYSACEHSTLLKIGCTAACQDDEICDGSRREILLRAQYLHQCDDCLEWILSKELEAHCREAQEAENKIAEDFGARPREMCFRQHALRLRLTKADSFDSKRTSQLTEEQQSMLSWVHVYACLIYRAKYAEPGGPKDVSHMAAELRAALAKRPPDCIVVRHALLDQAQLENVQKVGFRIIRKL